MPIGKDTDGKIKLWYIGKSYLCEAGRHNDCGGNCKCECHIEKKKGEE